MRILVGGMILAGVLAVMSRPAASYQSDSSPSMTGSGRRGLLCIRVVGLSSDAGRVRVGLYRSPETYSRRQGSFRKAELSIRNRLCAWYLDNVPYGEYGAMLYHDQNGNRTLDRNRFGLPIEPFGFSNNAKPRLGPPAYDRVKFEVDDDLTTVEISLQSR